METFLAYKIFKFAQYCITFTCFNFELDHAFNQKKYIHMLHH